MNILIIGGTRFIGPYVVRELHDAGDCVIVFHRGRSTGELPRAVEHIIGDRNNLYDFQETFKKLKPDIIIDMMLITNKQAEMLTHTFKGITKRVIGISSQDVYRAYGIMLGKEKGDLQPTPLDEDAALRSNLYPYRGITPRPDDDPHKILDNYDKIPVEKTLLNNSDMIATVLRLPMVYGPGDYQHRLYEYVKRMDDARLALIMDSGLAEWRSSFGYVENVAHAICCAAHDNTMRSRIYNVADAGDMTMKEWVRKIGQVAAWQGEIISLSGSLLPRHLDPGFNTNQHLNVSTERIRSDLGYQELIAIDQALARTIDWERNHPPENLDASQYDYKVEDDAIKSYRKRIH